MTTCYKNNENEEEIHDSNDDASLRRCLDWYLWKGEIKTQFPRLSTVKPALNELEIISHLEELDTIRK